MDEPPIRIKTVHFLPADFETIDLIMQLGHENDRMDAEGQVENEKKTKA